MLKRLIPRRFHHTAPAYEGFFKIEVKPNESFVEPQKAAQRLRRGMAVLIYAEQWMREVVGNVDMKVCPNDIARDIALVLEILRDRNAAWNLTGEKMRPINILMDCFGSLYDNFNALQDLIKGLAGAPIYLSLSKSTAAKTDLIVTDIRTSLKELLAVMRILPARKSPIVASSSFSPLDEGVRESQSELFEDESSVGADPDSRFAQTLSNASMEEVNAIRRRSSTTRMRELRSSRHSTDSLYNARRTSHGQVVHPDTTHHGLDEVAATPPISSGNASVEAVYRSLISPPNSSNEVPQDRLDEHNSVLTGDQLGITPDHILPDHILPDHGPYPGPPGIPPPAPVNTPIACTLPEFEGNTHHHTHSDLQHAVEDVLAQWEADAVARRSIAICRSKKADAIDSTLEDAAIETKDKEDQAPRRVKYSYTKAATARRLTLPDRARLIPKRRSSIPAMPLVLVPTTPVTDKLNTSAVIAPVPRSSRRFRSESNLRKTVHSTTPSYATDAGHTFPNYSHLTIQPLSPTFSIPRTESLLSTSTAPTEPHSPIVISSSATESKLALRPLRESTSSHLSNNFAFDSPPYSDITFPSPPISGLVSRDLEQNSEDLEWIMDETGLFQLDKSKRFTLSRLAELQTQFGAQLAPVQIKASKAQMRSARRLSAEIGHDGDTWRFMGPWKQGGVV